MDEHDAILIMIISGYSTGLPLLIALLRYRRLNGLQKYLFALVVFILVIEILANFIGRWYLHMNNLPLLHLFSVGQFTFLWLIFRRRIVPLIPKQTFQALLIVFYIFAVVSAVWIDGVFNFNAYARSFGAILLIFFCLTYYYQRLKMLDMEHLEQDPLFWISTGSLIYFSGSVILFVVSNYILQNEVMSIRLWGIHAVLNIFNIIFYAIALWVTPKRLA